MAILDTYPLFTVSKLAESQAFFVRCFQMRVVFEASWVVMLSHADDGAIRLGLMASDHPSSPPGPEAFDGKGALLTIQVDDAAALYTRLSQEGEAITYPLTDAAWGQRRFMLRDPSGIGVDVVEQIEAVAGFWEGYGR